MFVNLFLFYKKLRSEDWCCPSKIFLHYISCFTRNCDLKTLEAGNVSEANDLRAFIGHRKWDHSVQYIMSRWSVFKGKKHATCISSIASALSGMYRLARLFACCNGNALIKELEPALDFCMAIWNIFFELSGLGCGASRLNCWFSQDILQWSTSRSVNWQRKLFA